MLSRLGRLPREEPAITGPQCLPQIPSVHTGARTARSSRSQKRPRSDRPVSGRVRVGLPVPGPQGAAQSGLEVRRVEHADNASVLEHGRGTTPMGDETFHSDRIHGVFGGQRRSVAVGRIVYEQGTGKPVSRSAAISPT